MKSQTSIESKFQRSKNKGKLTKLWKDIPANLQSFILTSISLDSVEVPIIIFYDDINNWWLLTSKKIFISQKNKNFAINLFEIDNVELKKIFDGEVSKDKNSAVQILVKNVYFDLDVEQGTWPLVYDILRFVISK